ncbi:MAG TPA: ABC transporter ATP-binding protein [Candidatus Gastranaerophilaceae bacterium]|nr:ABC transporter ATP-binding protein [Candidatus Gastranaerophilaceae bacterium]
MSSDTMKLKDTVSKDAFRYGYLLGRIYPYLKPVLGRAILGLLIAIPLGLLDGVTAIALKPYLDNVINGSPNATFELLGKTFNSRIFWAMLIPPAIITFAVIQGGLKYINTYLTDWTGMKVSNSLKLDLFKKLTSLNSKFYDINSSGLVLIRFLNDPDAASRSIIDSVKTFITTIFGILGLVGVLLYTAWKLAIIGVTVLGLAMLPVAFIRKKIKSVSNASMVVGGGMTTNFNETFSGNKIIAAYNLQEQQNSAFESQINEQFNLSMTLTKRVGWLSPIMYFVASCGIAIVMAYGNHLIMTGEITSGSFAAFVTSLLLLYKPVKGLGQTLAGLQSTFVAMSRTFELFDLVPEIKNEPDAIELKGFEKQIEFKNVNFEYIEDTPVLKNLCLAVPKNETIALVGNSGGGKSTVVNLIPRFYDVKSGSIEIDGVNIKNFDLVSLRNQISFVFQDNFLFSGTIKENIIMGNKQASDEELQNVVKMAHLDEFIETLEKGIDTYVGERGATLSGGQRQRVAIARAMLKNAPIVILDEATSALDNKSEAIVQKALDNLMKNKTVFVIAHRLSTIKNADRIAVINEGELVELGTHDNLMRIENGKYKHLYEMQFKKVEQLNS